MRDYQTPAERRAEKKAILALEAEQRATTPGVKMTENQWRELRFTGRVKELGLVMLGDTASHQHKLTKDGESK